MTEVRSNKLQYSSMAVMRQFSNLKHILYFKYFQTNKPVIFGVCWAVLCALWFVPAIACAMYVIIAYQGATKMEEMLQQYVGGTLPKSVPANNFNSSVKTAHLQQPSSSDEIRKLLELKKEGAITEEEFQKAKTKFLAS